MASAINIILNAVDNASGTILKTDQSIGGLSKSIMGAVGPYLTYAAVGTAVVKGMQESIKATIEYANQVRSLSLISGESAEETSRFIQVLDDFKISADSAMTATRALTKEGLTPSIDTLAKLSDQYLALNNAQARNELVIKNLGRAGLQWVEVLNKGSDAIKEMGANVNNNLILNQKAVDNARKYEMALDGWNDSVLALKISVGNQLLPVLTDFTNATLDHAAALDIAREAGATYHTQSSLEYEMALQQVQVERERIEALMLQNSATSDLATNQENVLSLGLSLNEMQTSQNEKIAELNAKLADAIPLYGENSEEVAGLRGEIDSLNAANQKQTDMWILNMMKMSGATVEIQTAYAAAMGLIDADTPIALAAISSLNQQMKNGQISAQEYGQKVRAILTAVNKLNGAEATAYINIITSGSVPSRQTFQNIGTSQQIRSSPLVLKGQHQHGGEFIIPPQYGFEGFRLGNEGTASAGETVTITPKNQQNPIAGNGLNESDVRMIAKQFAAELQRLGVGQG